MIPTGLTGAAGLAAADLGARLALELEGDVLGDVADQVPSRSRSSNPRRPGAAGVLADAGQHLEQASVKPGIVFVGKCSSTPRSTMSLIAGS